MPHAMHAAAESWRPSVPLMLLLFSTAGVYVNGWRRLRAALPDMSVWHAAGFLGGLVSIGIAVASPLASWDGGSLTAHMIQHLLLMTCAPPLILLSDPVKCVLYGLPGRLAARATSVASRSWALQVVGSTLAHALVCWVAATAALVL